MGTLSCKDTNIFLKFRPYRVSDEKKPTWIAVELSLRKGEQKKATCSINLIDADLDEIIFGLDRLINRGDTALNILNVDEDFILNAYVEGRAKDKFVLEF